jgi:hypothetical protein
MGGPSLLVVPVSSLDTVVDPRDGRLSSKPTGVMFVRLCFRAFVQDVWPMSDNNQESPEERFSEACIKQRIALIRQGRATLPRVRRRRLRLVKLYTWMWLDLARALSQLSH